MKQFFGGDQTQNGISQEFKLLIVSHAGSSPASRLIRIQRLKRFELARCELCVKACSNNSGREN